MRSVGRDRALTVGFRSVTSTLGTGHFDQKLHEHRNQGSAREYHLE